jgi:hypothetical protein
MGCDHDEATPQQSAANTRQDFCKSDISGQKLGSASLSCQGKRNKLSAKKSQRKNQTAQK